MERRAIVVMSYGTNSSGQGTSPQTKDVLSELMHMLKFYDWLSDAPVILQGGYSHNGGPTESELMAEELKGQIGSRPIYLDLSSKDTIEGALEVRRIAQTEGITRLIILAQSFHAWRVNYTFARVLTGSGISHAVESDWNRSPFGGNSQRRLNSAARWWFWEILARAYTFLKLR